MTGVEAFLTLKAAVAGVGVVLTIVHMNQANTRVHDGAQAMRYVALLAAALAVAAASVEQLQAPGVPVLEYRNVSGMVVALLIVVAGALSVRASRRQDPPA